MDRKRTDLRQRAARVLAGASVLIGVGGVGLVGWGLTGGELPSLPDFTEPAPPPATPATSPMAAAEPVRIAIPTLDVRAPVMDLGLQADGSLEVPPGADRAGWYTDSPTPGELGPAIVAAHVNWNGEDGPFADAAEMKFGDRVRVARADGTTAVFAVTHVEQYSKDNFPTKQVYGNINHAGLRLITCGGEFMESVDSYADNIVVYARLVNPAPVGQPNENGMSSSGL